MSGLEGTVHTTNLLHIGDAGLKTGHVKSSQEGLRLKAEMPAIGDQAEAVHEMAAGTE